MARHYRFISADSHYESAAGTMDPSGRQAVSRPGAAAHQVGQRQRRLGIGRQTADLRRYESISAGALRRLSTRRSWTTTTRRAVARPSSACASRIKTASMPKYCSLSTCATRRSATKRRASAWSRASMIFSPKNTAPSIRDRLIGMAVLPNSGVAEDIAEMERCKRMGLKGAWLSTFPSGKGFPTPEDDRFWAAALDLDMPLVIHTSFPTKVGSRETPLFKYPKEPEGERRPPTDFVQRFARQAPHHSGSVEISQFIVAGIFDRFPKLQIYWAENNVGWLPYFGEQIDKEYETNHFWAEREMGLPRLKRIAERISERERPLGLLRRSHRHEAAPRDRRRPDHVVDGFSPCRHALAEFPQDSWTSQTPACRPTRSAKWWRRTPSSFFIWIIRRD